MQTSVKLRVFKGEYQNGEKNSCTITLIEIYIFFILIKSLGTLVTENEHHAKYFVHMFHREYAYRTAYQQRIDFGKRKADLFFPPSCYSTVNNCDIATRPNTNQYAVTHIHNFGNSLLFIYELRNSIFPINRDKLYPCFFS